jgi:integrase/recombinase XerD
MEAARAQHRMDARDALARVGLSVDYGKVEKKGRKARLPATPIATLPDAISSFLRALENRNRSAQTLNTYRAALGRFRTWLEAQPEACLWSDLTHQLAERYLDYLRRDYVSPRGRPLSDASVHQYIAVLKTFSEWGARGDRFWASSPLAEFEVPSFVEVDIQPFTHAELHALISACGSQRSFAGRRLLAMLLTALDTGMRRGEIRQLGLDMLDPRAGRIRLPAHITKTKRSRTVHLQEATLSAVRAWLIARNALPDVSSEVGPLFCQLDGRPISDGAMQELATRLRKRSGVSRFRWHLVRHTCGVESLRNGADSVDVQDTLGHTSLRMTRRYLQLTDEDRKQRHARYSPVQSLLTPQAPRQARFYKH